MPETGRGRMLLASTTENGPACNGSRTGGRLRAAFSFLPRDLALAAMRKKMGDKPELFI
jgi:hypothetical protein